jgi:colanic acid/amylovoran biosynthesis glycosyltransferase
VRKVLLFKTGPYLPVTENWIYGQISHLRRYKPMVYACNGQNLKLFPVERIRTTKFGDATQAPPVLRKLYFYAYFLFFLLTVDRPNVVHAHFGPSGQRFLVFERFIRVPLITSFYGYDVNQLTRKHPTWLKKYEHLFQKGDAFLVEGPYMKKSLIALGCPMEKVIVHHLGVDLERLAFLPRTIGESRTVRILMAASFREKKGIPYGVEAFGRFKESNREIDATLTIIGDSSGREDEEAQKRLVLRALDKYNLHGTVQMLGYQPHDVFIKELYRHHIFMAPSIVSSDWDSEGGAPVSVIEASASGMPVISTHHCDIPEVVLDGKSGFLVPERDAVSLAGRLEFLALNRGVWREMGHEGRQHIERDFDTRKQVRLLEEIYDTFSGAQSEIR